MKLIDFLEEYNDIIVPMMFLITAFAGAYWLWKLCVMVEP
jgi:hypothetical protein